MSEENLQDRAGGPGSAEAALSSAFKAAGWVVGGVGAALAAACAVAWTSETRMGWFVAALAFLLGAVAGGGSLWGVGWLISYTARTTGELRDALRQGDWWTVPAPPPAPAPEGPEPQPVTMAQWEAFQERLEQVHADVLLTDQQRQQKLLRVAQSRLAEMAGQAGEDVADGRLEAAQRRMDEMALLPGGQEHVERLRGELTQALVRRAQEAIAGGELEAARGCMERLRQVAPECPQMTELRERLLTFFAERAERAILGGDFRRGEDWVEELAEADPEDLRVVELRAKLDGARGAIVAAEFGKGKRMVEELLAIADYDRAEAAAEQMLERLGATEEVQAFVDMVRGEATAFRDEQRRRMLEEIRQYAEGRQWRKALDAARELLSEHPRSRQGEEVRGMMLRLEENARIEEVRELRDRITDLIERKRFTEAVQVAEDVIHRFPDTQAAGQLSREIDKLRRRAGMGEGA